jgi:PAS domain S-box-containing protein
MLFKLLYWDKRVKMQKPSIPENEVERQAELNQFEILDTEPELSFDDLTILASQICETKISLISLIDNDRQWFKSRTGLDATETPRDISWCGHAILQDELFEVPDAAEDERFKDNPLFLGEPNVRFYAGMPLVTQNGYKIGTLCVIDEKPKKLNDWQKEVLRKLSRQAVLLIESRIKEKKLSEANLKLETIVNNIPVMLTSYNDKGEVEWVNREWKDELGWDLEEMKRIDILEKMYPDPTTQQEVRKFIQSDQPEWKDFYTTKKNGHSFYTSWTIVKLENDHYIGIGQNIHERKSIEALAQDVQRLTKVGGWQYLIESEEVKWTEETFRIYGLPVSKRVNLSAAINCYAPHEREKISKLVMQGITEGLPWDGEFEFIDVQGNPKWVRSIGEPVRNQEGKIYKIKGTFQDITELKNLQLKLESERKLSLHQAKLASIGNLASGVAHEINNPLTIIKGYITVIKEMNNFDPDTLSRLEKMNYASDRIKTIVNSLRTFSRSDIEEIGLFNLAEVVKDSFDLVSEIYKKENISLVLNMNTGEEAIILGNRGRLSQVIMNLLANAKDANSKMEDRKITMSLMNKENSAILKVEDNGKGIEKSIKDKIFDPFFTTKDVNEGTGIGLSIVSSIVKEHEGHISFETALNQGTTFTIKIPLDESGKSLKKQDQVKGFTTGNVKLNILIADDEDDIRNILKILFNKIGVEVTLAANGLEAFELLQKKTFDLLITDVKMPILDGPGLVRKLRANTEITQPKIILMTGGVDQKSIEVFESEVLVEGFIYKPFNQTVLYGKLQELFPNRDWPKAK